MQGHWDSEGSRGVENLLLGLHPGQTSYTHYDEAYRDNHCSNKVRIGRQRLVDKISDGYGHNVHR